MVKLYQYLDPTFVWKQAKLCWALRNKHVFWSLLLPLEFNTFFIYDRDTEWAWKFQNKLPTKKKKPVTPNLATLFLARMFSFFEDSHQQIVWQCRLKGNWCFNLICTCVSSNHLFLCEFSRHKCLNNLPKIKTSLLDEIKRLKCSSRDFQWNLSVSRKAAITIGCMSTHLIQKREYSKIKSNQQGPPKICEVA